MNRPPGDEAWLQHERLDVYKLALEFYEAAMACLPKQGDRSLRDQLDRASSSIVFNIAEGAGRTARGDKRHAYSIAMGSATECAAILDVIRIKTVAPPHRIDAARAMIVRIVQMLARLSGGPRDAKQPVGDDAEGAG